MLHKICHVHRKDTLTSTKHMAKKNFRREAFVQAEVFLFFFFFVPTPEFCKSQESMIAEEKLYEVLFIFILLKD